MDKLIPQNGCRAKIEEMELEERRSLLIDHCPAQKYGTLNPSTPGAVNLDSFPGCNTFKTHRIAENETIQGIALKYNSSVQYIKQANGIFRDLDFQAKSKILIPVSLGGTTNSGKLFK